MLLFYYKLGIITLPPIAKIMENQNFKCINLGTMILRLQTYKKNEAELFSNSAIKGGVQQFNTKCHGGRGSSSPI